MAECAIPYCGEEDCTQMMQCCERGHVLHLPCFMRYVVAARPMLCPLCRSNVIESVIRTVHTSQSFLLMSPYSILAAELAMSATT